VVFALWFLLWALVPALLVWGLKPYVRQATFLPVGRSQAELEADLNHRYAVEYLGLGGLLGMVGGGVALWLRRAWQVLALAVVVGVALVAAFDLRHAPPFWGWRNVAGDALLAGGIGGVLLGTLLSMVHRRTGRCTGLLQGRDIVKAMTLSVAILAMVCAARAEGADQSDVQNVLDRFQSVRPHEADLALYQLDWMPTLKAAQERAAREERPIFLVVVTNSFGDLYTGHC
jgi:hypothetical protein